MTWQELAIAAGYDRADADFALWNLTAFPFADVRTIWYQLRQALRLRDRSGFWPDSPNGGFRWEAPNGPR